MNKIIIHADILYITALLTSVDTTREFLIYSNEATQTYTINKIRDLYKWMLFIYILSTKNLLIKSQHHKCNYTHLKEIRNGQDQHDFLLYMKSKDKRKETRGEKEVFILIGISTTFL
jgi:hypothetical protein